jgi:uncharacterized protein YdeI (YjbR/CyaY-like superfamily)
MKPEPRLQPDSLASWRDWLLSNHKSSRGVWLITFKKCSGKQIFGFDLAIEEALCFGWIDSLPRALDQERTMLRFSPRKSDSAWSGVNKLRVEKLIAGNRMHESGLEIISKAKENGAWSRLDSASRLEIPAELEEALAKVPSSEANFSAFPPSSRRAILEWIAQAKKSETRNKRIEETARLAGLNVRANQWKT